jgi:hypothetical protein
VPRLPPRPPGAEYLPVASMMRPSALPESPRAAGRLQPGDIELARSRSDMKLRPLRSVGKISHATDPSKLTAWQYRTLRRTQPESHLTRRAAHFHPQHAAMRASLSAGDLHAARTPTPAQPAEAVPETPPGSAVAPPPALDPAAALDASVEDLSALAGRGRTHSNSGRGPHNSTRCHHSATREEAAAFIAEAEHYIESASQALHHLALNSPAPPPAPAAAAPRRAQRRLGTLPASAAREAQTARMAQKAQAPAQEPSAEDELATFSEKLLSDLHGVPGVPLQILRLMRRGDWRVRG